MYSPCSSLPPAQRRFYGFFQPLLQPTQLLTSRLQRGVRLLDLRLDIVYLLLPVRLRRFKLLLGLKTFLLFLLHRLAQVASLFGHLQDHVFMRGRGLLYASLCLRNRRLAFGKLLLTIRQGVTECDNPVNRGFQLLELHELRVYVIRQMPDGRERLVTHATTSCNNVLPSNVGTTFR